MAGKKPTPDEFMAALTHAHKAKAEALRSVLRKMKTPALAESLKWNAPSYSVGGIHFVTFNFGCPKSIRLVFHSDTARKETKGAAPILVDETGLLAWQSNVRAIAVFRSDEEIAAAKTLLPGLVRQWVDAVKAG